MNSYLNSFFSTLLIFIPLANCYAFIFFDKISIGSLLSLICFIVVFIYSIFNFRSLTFFNFPIIYFFTSFFFSLSIFIFAHDPTFDFNLIIFSLSKLFIWAILTAFSYKIVDYYKLRSLIFSLSILSMLYFLFEIFCIYVLGLSVGNGLSLPGIKIFYDDYNHEFNNTVEQLRLSSFYLEPNQLSNLLVLSLIILIFDKSRSISYRYTFTFLHITFIFLSTSSAGIYSLFLISLIYIFRFSFVLGLIITFCFTFLFLFIYSNPQEVFIFFSQFGSLGFALGIALSKISSILDSSRIGGSFGLLDYLTFDHFIIGYTIGYENVVSSLFNHQSSYANSITRVLFGAGVYGLILFLFFLLFLLNRFRSIPLSFSLILIVIFSGLYSGLWFSPDSIIYFTVAFSFYKINEYKYNV